MIYLFWLEIIMIFFWLEKKIRYPGYDDTGDADADFGVLEQFVAQVDAVPEGDEVFLDLGVVAVVQPIAVVVDDDQDFWVDGGRSTALLARRSHLARRRHVHLHKRCIFNQQA